MPSPLESGSFPIAAASAYLLVLVWLVAEYQFVRYTRRRGAPGFRASREDRGSYYAIIGSIWAGLSWALFVYFLGLGPQLDAISIPPGVALAVVGIALRGWALTTLGRNFSLVVRTSQDQRLVTEGPYRWLRHPAYSSNLLVTAGIALVLGNLLGLLATVVLVSASHLYRIRVEERALVARFGGAYREYETRTWRLIPGVY
ncbi:MAG TPA: isoprenylcysteine carboxylmethyltransferase family protein [Thermoplasmata archaeon]|nr:isoprenylcysteine carboxylmethyltransferase family protein [Thermoplasmata archaeon]